MLVKLAPTGATCLDAAGFISTQAVRNACQLDYVHAFSFYIGNRYGVSKTQFQIAFDHGKLVSPNREGDSHEAYSWASGPVREIDETRRILDSFGIDWRNVPTIDSAVDWNPSASEIPRCDDWWKAYVDHALDVGFWGGYYGATAYGKRLTGFPWWPDNFAVWTWGGAGEITGSHMKQWFGYPSGNDYSSIGVTVDESTVRAGLLMASSFDSTPPPQEDEMAAGILMVNSEPYPQFEPAKSLGYVPPDGVNWPVGWIWFLLVPDGGKRWLTGEEFGAWFAPVEASTPGAPIVLQRTTGQLQSIPDYKPVTSGQSGPAPKTVKIDSVPGVAQVGY